MYMVLQGARMFLIRHGPSIVSFNGIVALIPATGRNNRASSQKFGQIAARCFARSLRLKRFFKLCRISPGKDFRQFTPHWLGNCSRARVIDKCF
jgi:hypothetical protein